MLVIARLEALDSGYKTLHRELEDLRIELVKIQIAQKHRAAWLGFVGGAIPAIAALVYSIIRG